MKQDLRAIFMKCTREDVTLCNLMTRAKCLVRMFAISCLDYRAPSPFGPTRRVRQGLQAGEDRSAEEGDQAGGSSKACCTILGQEPGC